MSSETVFDRLIEEDEQVVECRNCGSKWSINTVSTKKGQIIAVLLECPLCERKEKEASC